jgi:flagellar hook-length control protein FliK
MAGSLIDTLLQTVVAPRTSEPARGAESRGGGSEFRPVLDEALTAGPKETAAPTTTLVDDDAEDSADDVTDEGLTEESNCVQCPLPEERNDATTDDTADATAVAASEETGDDGDEEEASDAVDISLAAAEAASAAEASQPKLVTADTAPATKDGVNEASIVPADADAKNAGADAAAKRSAEAAETANTSDAAARSTEIEIGDVRPTSPKLVRDAPPDATTLEEATELAKRKASAAGKPVAKAKTKPEAESKAATADQAVGDAAPTETASSNEAVSAEAVANEDTATREPVAEKSGEVLPESKEAPAPQRDRQPEPNAQTNTTLVNDASETAPTNSAPTSAATPSPTEARSEATPVAAVTAPTAPSSDASVTNRSATAIARLSAERSLHSNGSQGDDVDSARFVSRVEGAVRAAQQRDGRIQVRLSPPELGALRIELTIQNGVMSARLEAETPAARNLLLDNLPALRDRLAQQEVRIDQFDVDVRRDNGGSAGGNAGQNGPGDRPAQESGWRQNQQRQDRGAPGLAKQSTPTRRNATASDAALDVRV